MIKTSFFIIFLFAINALFGQSLIPAWVVSSGSVGNDAGMGVVIDNHKNSIITGYFSGTSDFGNGNSAISYGIDDIFIAKYSKDGLCKWVKTAGGNNSDQARGITIDNNGNYFIVGYFDSPFVTFENGIMIQNSGGKDAFVAKYDSNGICLFAKPISGTNWQWSYGISTDISGNFYATGQFTDTANFGNGVQLVSTTQGWNDFFVVKYNSSGVCQWAKKTVGVYLEHGNSLHVDNSGNIFLTGYFDWTVHFGTDSVVSNGQSDVFLTKIDNNGNFLWVRSFGDTLDDYGKSVYTDTDGNCYVSGSFYGTVNFGNNHIATSNGEHDFFIAKFDPTGNCSWVNHGGGSMEDVSYGISSTPNGQSYITGNFSNVADFGNSISLTSTGLSDIFMASYDSNGLCNWALQAGGDSMDGGYGVAVDTNEFYFSGYYKNAATFGLNQLSGNGGDDIFLAKYVRCYEPTIVPVTTDLIFCENSQVLLKVMANGTAPFTYQWFKNEILINGANSDSLFINEVLVADSGLYKCIVSNLCGSDTTENIHIKINKLPIVNFNGLATDYCFSDSIALLVGNYSPNGSFNGLGLVENIFNPALSQIGNNQITYTYTDANNCTNSISKNVVINAVPVLNIFKLNSSCGIADGFAIINVSGGTPPYSYSNGNDTLYFLYAGIYDVTVTDFNLCKTKESIIIQDVSAPVISVQNTNNATCSTSCDGQATVSIIGGNEPYIVYWNNGNTALTNTTLCIGNNYVKVTDHTGCVSVSSINISYFQPEPSIFGRITFSQGVVSGTTAKLKLFSTTHIDGGGFNFAHTTALIGSDGSYIISNIPPDDYILQVNLIGNSYQHLANSYYTTGQPTNKWDQATHINIQCGQTKEANIQMKELPSLSNGKGLISGHLYYSESSAKDANQKGVSVFTGKSMGEPVPGAEIYVELEPDDQPIANTETDYSGSYIFTDVPNGNYSINVEIPGFPQISTYNFSILGSDTVFTGLNFILDTTTSHGEIDTSRIYVPENEHIVFEAMLYPNPHKDFINISYKLDKTCDVSFEIIDINGKSHYSNVTVQQPEGSYIQNLNTDMIGLTSGTYLLLIKVNKTVYLKKIVKTAN